MSRAREDLALRRRHLVIRSTEARAQLLVQSAALLPLLTVGDRVRAAVRWVRQHPHVVFTLTVVIVVTRPRVAWRWAFRAWSAVRFMRKVRQRLAAWEPR